MKTGNFLAILMLSALIICLSCHILSAQNSESDQFGFDEYADYRDLQLTVTKGGAEEFLPSNLDESSNIDISLDSDKPVFSAGDLLSFTAAVDRDCHLTVMYVSQSGKVIVLLNSLARADVPIQIPARQSRFQLQVDGKQPYETILAYATTGRNNILDEDRLSDIPGTDFRVFNGSPAELVEVFQDLGKGAPAHEPWGTAQLNVRISSGRGSAAESDADAKAEAKSWGPVAIKARGGGYLSVKDGRISLVKKMTPSAVLQLQAATGDQVRIVGRYGTVNELFGFTSNMFIFAPQVKKNAQGNVNDEKVIANSPRRSQRAVFLLAPVKPGRRGKKDISGSHEFEPNDSSFEKGLIRK